MSERRFRAEELRDGTAGPDETELATIRSTAEAVDRTAADAGPRPGVDFVDRVMAEVAQEPLPAPIAAAGAALREHKLRGFLGALGDTARVAFGGGRPLVLRGQAMAFLLIIAIGVVALAGATTVAASRFFSGPPGPSPTVALPSTSPSPSESARPSIVPLGSQEPSLTPDLPTDSSPAGSGAVTPTPSPSPAPSSSVEPSETPKPTDARGTGETAKPSETPKPSH